MRAISKFAMLVIAVVSMMGMTSCNPSEKESKVYSGTVIARYYHDKSVFVDGEGAWLMSKDPYETAYLDDGIYRFDIDYNPAETQDGVNMVDIKSKFDYFDNENVLVGEAPKDMYPMYSLDYSKDLRPGMFDRDYLFVPCLFWSSYFKEDATVDLENHRFSIIYDPSKEDASTTTLKLMLTDELIGNQSVERKTKTFRFQAFNLRRIIADFRSRHGDLSKIELSCMVNSESASISDAKLETFNITYSAKFKD